jgi:alpha-beta hydrolase superfamily lysophospholipase
VQHLEDTFAGAAGVDIYWQAWLPTDEPRAIVVIAHGAGEHSARYAHVAERLTGAGYAVYALDHRGHGRSQGRRAMFERLDLVLEDLSTLIARARDQHAGHPVFLLGHSLGGAVALAYAGRHGDQLAGLVLSGPVAAMETASPVTRIAARVLSTLTPNLGLMDVDSTQISRDPDVVRAYQEDPLVYRGKFPARTISEVVGEVTRFPQTVTELRMPLLIMHGTADTLAPPAGSKMVAERAGSQDKTLKLYDGLYHEVFNEPEQDQVIGDLVEWLDARVTKPAHPVAT